jgi:hypothetical protein
VCGAGWHWTHEVEHHGGRPDHFGTEHTLRRIDERGVVQHGREVGVTFGIVGDPCDPEPRHWWHAESVVARRARHTRVRPATIDETRQGLGIRIGPFDDLGSVTRPLVFLEHSHPWPPEDRRSLTRVLGVVEQQLESIDGLAKHLQLRIP